MLGSLLLVLGACASGPSSGAGAEGSSNRSGAAATITAATTTVAPTLPPTTVPPTTVPPTSGTTLPGPCGDTSTWSVRQRLAQLVLVGIEGSAVEDATSVLVGPEPAAGVFTLGQGDQLFRDGRLAALRAQAAVPPLVAVDEEGGRVQRLEGLVGAMPSARSQAASLTPADVEALATAKGQAMKALGVDIDFAPVVDVVSEATTGGVIGDRAYGADPTSVAAYAGAFAAGLRRAGILPTLKHFPGHGRAVGDSHEELATAPPLAELEQLDLVPYRELLDDGPSAVMVGHLDVAGLTEPGLPASLSPATYALLRDQLGFAGLVVTDELGGMAAVSSRFSAPEAVVRALAAGADLALVTGADQLGAVLDELVAASSDGRLPAARVNEALGRVLASKGC